MSVSFGTSINLAANIYTQERNIDPSIMRTLFNVASVCVAIEGFVLYAGGDYALHLNIMLLVQVWRT